MTIKLAVVLLGAVCIGGPLLQTLRFRRFAARSPWQVPLGFSREGIGWLLVAVALGLLIGMGGLIVAGHPIADRIPGFGVPDPVRLAGLAVGAAGAVFAFHSQSAMGASWRVGTDEASERELVTGGIYSRIRNPIYLGLLIQMIGAAILVANAGALAALIAGTAGLHQIITSEERFLIQKYGQAYADYMARTGRLLPRMGGRASEGKGSA
ncbi:MAG: isoprenylcysteine carboxylmethyltransferase family protein [Candidatus Sericytochromatia bacterium]|uniref:Isoprenylcysteine carboxylmethyltransferase family protein n=1 Tax=Candidatus Tanganyikabacteria bacterium TaxID=2961651 RepID=A0A938BM12_9BACT|nr:isoprenylcysteine carboxylmethyltransferase family protein [Candidatus Tanganyikabacteria bacterium]